MTGRIILKSRSKYRNQPTVVDGIRFASKKEATRWGELKLMEAAGEIASLVRQKSYRLEFHGVLVCRYIADFAYWDMRKNPPVGVVEDVKGQKAGPAWDMFRIKAKLMKAIYDIEVKVV